MSGNTRVAWFDPAELARLPVEARRFHLRARIVDATVREVAAHGYDRVSEAGIARRAGVSSRVFFGVFSSKAEALLWACEAAAAYAVPQVVGALRAEASWERGIAAAVITYAAILDCDHDWATAWLRDLPVVGEGARALRDELRAPVVEAVEGRLPPAENARKEGGTRTVMAALDALVVDALVHEPDRPLLAGQEELVGFVLTSFGGVPPVGVQGAVLRPTIAAGQLETLVAEGDLDPLVREAIARRDGATLWQVIVALRHHGDGAEGDLEQRALQALEDAWPFGVPLGHAPSADEALGARDRLARQSP